MKIESIRQALLLIIVTSVFYSKVVVAEPEWYVCKIDSIGSQVYKQKYKKSGKWRWKNAKQALLQLDDVDGAFIDTEFRIHDAAEKEMMALALTAVSNGFDIEVYVDMSRRRPVITEMHLVTN